MSWKDILKAQSVIEKVKEFVEHIKGFFVKTPKGLITRYTNQLEKVEKQLEQIVTYVSENNLGRVSVDRYPYYGYINIYESSKKHKTDIKLEQTVKDLLEKRRNLRRKLQKYNSIDEKLEIFNDPIKLTEYGKRRYYIDLTEPKMLQLFMETMRLEGLEPIEGAVKLASNTTQKEKEINFALLQQTVNMLAYMNKKAPLKQEVAKEMEIDINQEWDYRADEAYEKAIQLLRQRGKI
jgi:hypothetical protein